MSERSDNYGWPYAHSSTPHTSSVNTGTNYRGPPVWGPRLVTVRCYSHDSSVTLLIDAEHALTSIVLTMGRDCPVVYISSVTSKSKCHCPLVCRSFHLQWTHTANTHSIPYIFCKAFSQMLVTNICIFCCHSRVFSILRLNNNQGNIQHQITELSVCVS